MTVSIVPRGLGFGRYMKALAIAKGDWNAAAAYAAGQRSNWRDSGDVEYELKAGVAAMTSNDALVAPSGIAADIIELGRPRSLIDRIPGFRVVPLNTWVMRFSGDVYASTVAAGAPTPVSKFSLERVQLDPIKITAMTVSTDELVRHANPAAELALGRELARALGTKGDLAFIDPDRSGSITNGATVINSTGSSLAAIDADLRSMIAYFAAADAPLDTAVFAMTTTTAAYLATLRGSGGALAFPTITARGGTLIGIPVFVSAALRASGSPEGAIVLLDANQILVGDSGEINLAAGKEATLEMLDNPTNNSVTGTATTMVSMFQTNSVAMRAERWVGWKRASDTAVVVLDNVQY